MGKKPKLKEKEFRITFKVTAEGYDPDENPDIDLEDVAEECKERISEVLNEYEWLKAGSGYEGPFGVDEVDVEA